MKMLLQTNDINLTGFYQQQEYYLQTHENEYRNLMVLVKDKICPDDFGQCGGMGRCGTCLVRISGVVMHPGDRDRNEQATLSKMSVDDLQTRLSCQVQINVCLKNAVVEILENVY